MTIDYRGSHTAVGYGETYDRTYREGYYKEQWDQLEQPLLRSVFSDLRASGAETYLDFACGTGRILSVGESIFPTSFGVDVSEAMLSQAAARCPGSTIRQIDLTRESLGRQFDVVSAFRFFLNAQPQLRREAVAAIASHLAPGGALVANVHVNRSSILGLAYRFRNTLSGATIANVMGFNELEDLFEGAGLQIEAAHWYSYWPRTGWRGAGLAARLLKPVDRFVGRLPAFAQRWSQSFMVVARRATS